MANVWSRLSRQLSIGGSKLVVSDSKTAWTGTQVLDAAGKLGDALRQCGVGCGDRVAIHLGNSAEYVAGILACLKLGAAFVPIAFHNPTLREVDILNRCRASAALIDKSHSDSIRLISQTAIPAIDVWSVLEEGAAIPRAELPVAILDEQSAYCVFTSGSTGEPKGVLISNHSLNHFIDCTISTFGLTPDTRALCVSPFNFDGAFGSIFAVLAVGGGIVISTARHLTPTEFIRLCAGNGITHTSFSPSFLRVLAESAHLDDLALTKLRTIGLGGEDCRREDLMRLKQSCPKIRVFNRYGPTETTVVVASCELTPELLHSNEKLPIGSPAPGTEFYLADGDEIVSEVGRPGELLIGGAQLMQGYLDAPAQTAAVLELALIPGKTLYRSGDLVYRDEAGRYVYLDRLDNVVNRNGVRISLSEVSRACLSLQGVNDAATVSSDTRQGLRIFVYLATDCLKPSDIRNALLKLLPPQMQPDRILCLRELPRLTSGKLDMSKIRILGADEPDRLGRGQSTDDGIVHRQVFGRPSTLGEEKEAR